ncbi:hypothetical protein SODALDRAFT_67940 [Sodiomyces alkalinus F11]|uniref:Uncharacterized protein n=1 Tax=Sodiomyces alkalinus (strain CBS 110278 / VKM F-3762 / F11) TaxID=1314773 RepID=A0A3N2PM48_SODAK|nr:hypothetical protein SODALDRAFT_67940 [Sodiomyces alkalinus F11]ROT35490.1 hypothetical protein SODALDRAFT_67940 [Sodiomyces alkalinus F11]
MSPLVGIQGTCLRLTPFAVFGNSYFRDMDWEYLVRSRRLRCSGQSPLEPVSMKTPTDDEQPSRPKREAASATPFRDRLFGKDIQNQVKPKDIRPSDHTSPHLHRFQPYSRPVSLGHDRTRARGERLHALSPLDFAPGEPLRREDPALYRADPISIQSSHLPRHSGSVFPWESSRVANSQLGPESGASSASDPQPWKGLREAMELPSKKLEPRRPDKLEAQLLARIKTAYVEKGEQLHSQVFDLLDGAHTLLCDKLSAIVTEDRGVLESVQNLSANFDKPLSESYTYKKSDSEPREKQMVGTAAERLRKEAAETAEFLQRNLKELDAAKTAENEAFNKILMGSGDPKRDAAFDEKMGRLKQETIRSKKEALRKLEEIEEELEEEKREILEELWLQS